MLTRFSEGTNWDWAVLNEALGKASLEELTNALMLSGIHNNEVGVSASGKSQDALFHRVGILDVQGVIIKAPLIRKVLHGLFDDKVHF